MRQLKDLIAESEVPESASFTSDWYEDLEKINRSRCPSQSSRGQGLDIQEMTNDGHRVIGELKTTKAYYRRYLGSMQRSSF